MQIKINNFENWIKTLSNEEFEALSECVNKRNIKISKKKNAENAKNTVALSKIDFDENYLKLFFYFRF